MTRRKAGLNDVERRDVIRDVLRANGGTFRGTQCELAKEVENRCQENQVQVAVSSTTIYRDVDKHMDDVQWVKSKKEYVLNESLRNPSDREMLGSFLNDYGSRLFESAEPPVLLETKLGFADATAVHIRKTFSESVLTTVAFGDVILVFLNPNIPSARVRLFDELVSLAPKLKHGNKERSGDDT